MPRASRLLRRLFVDRRAVSIIEFGYALPIFAGIAMYGIENANLALANLRISQLALNLADNASRVGLQNSSNEQLRESDINDVLAALKQRGATMALGTRGRVTLSSLENIGGTQRIHWQRCFGAKSGTGYESSYGRTYVNGSTTVYNAAAGTDTTAANVGTAAAGGMGSPAVNSPAGTGVMFVEINYDYRPVVSSAWVGNPKLHYVASFVVRDDRDFTQIYNSTVATRASCDKYPTS